MLGRTRGTLGCTALLLVLGCSGGTTLEGNLPDRAGPGTDGVPGAPRFAISICESRGGIPGYTYEELEAHYGSCTAATGYYTLTERDVELYRVPAAPDGRVELELTAAASAALRLRAGDRDVGWVFGEDPFAVALDGARLFLGLDYFIGGAAALQFPVLHVQDEAGRIWLRIGEYQGSWAGWGPTEPVVDPRVDPPELRTFFRELGRLAER